MSNYASVIKTQYYSSFLLLPLNEDQQVGRRQKAKQPG